jgi:hypothetical protein
VQENRFYEAAQERHRVFDAVGAPVNVIPIRFFAAVERLELRTRSFWQID